MKKAAFAVLVVSACVAFGFGQDVQIKDQMPFVYAYLECSGSFSQISGKIGEFMNAYFGQGLNPSEALFAIYFNTPGQVPEAELKWLIGMPVSADVTPAAPLQKGEFKYPKVASCIHIGPYEKVGETYAKMMAYISQNGWNIAGPAMEWYLDNPMAVAPENLRTEVILPVEKK
ncbi:MAG: GyrI-like domain-containing protein [Candidatus Aminicenantes bacterium]|nr:GyrI-like domain-containing protein [Candidatus Aminicenantes bacterium]